MRELYLGLDVGTQGTKGIVLDAERGVVARAGERYGLIAGLGAGAAEQHPQTWIDALGAVARELWRQVEPRAGELRGVGVSGQQHGLVVLDEQDDVVRPAKLWCDTTTAAEATELSLLLGRAIPAGFTAPKVLWMQRHEPELWSRVRRVFLPHEYVNFVLTGRATAEAGDASGTGWFDAMERAYDGLEVLGPGFEALLPELLAPGELAGKLTTTGAQLLSLPASFAGVPIAAGGGDNMLSAIGAGATRAGVAVLSLGTSATVFTRADAPVNDPEGAIAAFCDSTGAWLPLLCVMNATGVLEEVATSYGLGLDELTRRAELVPPLSSGLLFVPYLVGERVPNLPHARGSLHGIAPGSLAPGTVFRAALEGVAMNLAWGVERMRALGLTIDRVRVVGGGSNNALWRKILASALNAPLERCIEPESAAFGAALQALWTTRRAEDASLTADEACAKYVELDKTVDEPDASWVAEYRELLERFREAVKSER